MSPAFWRSRCGVVLQRLVPAEAAGVLFSVDPVTGADELVVEASWALGEAVVGGLVIPDRYRLDRDGRVVEQVIGHKDRAVVPRPGALSITSFTPASRARRRRPSTPAASSRAGASSCRA